MSVRSRGNSGEAVAAVGGVGFPSLTALRRSDLLVVFPSFLMNGSCAKLGFYRVA
jgi:hypothetical protein